ncbi:hypothetical protein CK203_084203 [Vitis vinifera]|uniref:Uncharacterized protein n=1 Tax=Vitis vinifera TaxID=29760 RepID=A0A438DRA6_VITVI|nr:hypothetical protein CK203_084203 [Vitis vinifera]
MENSEVSLEHEESTSFKRKTPAPPSVIHLAMIYCGNTSYSAPKPHFPNPPDPTNPDPAALREQWRYAIRQYSKWYSHAWAPPFSLAFPSLPLVGSSRAPILSPLDRMTLLHALPLLLLPMTAMLAADGAKFALLQYYVSL